MTETRSNHFGPSCADLELRDCFYFGSWSWIGPVLINEWRWTWEGFFLGGSRWFEPVLAPYTNVMSYCAMIFYLDSLHTH